MILSLEIYFKLIPYQTSWGINVVLAISMALDGCKEDKCWRERAKGNPEASLADVLDSEGRLGVFDTVRKTYVYVDVSSQRI